MFRTITAKFSGTRCRRCGGPIALGSKFRWGGRGRSYHLAASCPAADPGLRFSSPLDFSAEPRRDPTLHGLHSGRYDGLDPFKGGEEATDADSFTFDSGHAPDIDVLWEDDCARRAGVA